jgi:hypothetical protein
MAEIVFSDEELAYIDGWCLEYDPATHWLTEPHLQQIEDEQLRSDVTEMMRRALRGELFGALMLHAVAKAADSTGIGCERSFVFNALAEQRPYYTWGYDMGQMGETIYYLTLARMDLYGEASEGQYKSVRHYFEDSPIVRDFWRLLDLVRDLLPETQAHQLAVDTRE